MKNLICACLAGALAASGAANAAVLNFVATAAGNEGGVADGTTINYDGLAATFSSGGAGSFYAYFDDLFEGRPAGLGACEVLDGAPPADCLDAADDNVGAGESVRIVFDHAVDLSGFSFSGEQHFSLNDSDGTLLINGQAFTFVDVVSLTAAVAAVVSGLTFVEFAYGGPNALPFYVNSITAAVPLPAAAPLLLAGFAGLSFASRKRKQA